MVLLGGPALRRCLDSLPATLSEVVVVGPPRLLGPAPAAGAAQVQQIACEAPVPRRRAVGVAATSSEWVVVVEDTCVLAGDWAAALATLAAAEPTLAAVGGPVELSGSLGSRGIAFGCVEYGEYADTRLPDGSSVRRLHGLCTLYRRAALPRPAQLLIDTEVQAGLLANGHRLEFRHGFATRLSSLDDRMATCGSRRIHGQIYGGLLRARLGHGARLAAAAKCLLLPVVLAWRAGRGIPARSRHRLSVWSAILALTTGWACGELLGLLFGSRDALEEWQ